MTDVEIKEDAIKQGIEIVNMLKNDNLSASPDTKIVAVIAYLQKLGKYDTPEIENKLKNAPGTPQLIPGPGNPDKNRTGGASE
jgi:cytochrome c oxidase cbb3-type subunit I/II